MLKSAAGLAFAVLLLLGGFSESRAQCDPRDRDCAKASKAREPVREHEFARPSATTGGSHAPSTAPGAEARTPGASSEHGGFGGTGAGSPAGGGHGGTGSSIPAAHSGKAPATAAGSARETAPLQPVRAYLRARDIPPSGAGAYGLVVLNSRPTPASRAKFMMVCRSFVAFFPRSQDSSVPVNDQMITVWPLDDPESQQARADDCDHVLDHYDLIASEDAIRDAQKQRVRFDGEGPYLVGWSPSRARGIPDALVLVVDMSADNTQADIDNKFRFWKDKIVEDPSLWRNGWSAEAIRVAIHNFADQYGQAMLDAIKLIGGDK
jgi:hypothetical protein